MKSDSKTPSSALSAQHQALIELRRTLADLEATMENLTGIQSDLFIHAECVLEDVLGAESGVPLGEKK